MEGEAKEKHNHITKYLKDEFNTVDWWESNNNEIVCGEDGQIDPSHIWIVEKAEITHLDDIIEQLN